MLSGLINILDAGNQRWPDSLSGESALLAVFGGVLLIGIL